MTTKLSVILFSVFLILSAAVISVAQTPVIQDGRRNNPEKSGVEGLDRADRMMRLGQYDKAADLLELLFEKNPNNISIKNLLATCYEHSKDYPRMVLFLKRRLATEPPGYQLYRAVGRAYVLTGSPDSAKSFFYHAVRLVKDNERAFASIADIYHKFGHYRLESEFIDSSRTLIGNPLLLADRMGDALAAQRQYGPATLEYLAYMDKDTLAAKIATEKLEMMMKFPESADTVMTILSDRIRQQADNKRLLNTYGRLLMEQDRYDEAFTFFKGLDSLEAGQGGSIVYFMRECNRHGSFENTLRGGRYLLEHKPQSSLINGILFIMADAFIATGKYNEALAAYQSIGDDHLRPAHRAEAYLKTGILYKDYLGDLEKAKELLSDVTKTVPGGGFDTRARIALADVAIREGSLDSAIILYQSLQERELPEEIYEKMEFSLAEIFLFQENYKEATTRFRQIISRYPRGFYVNDAIQYSLLISETLDEAPKHIDLFASAEYFRYTGQSDSLEYYLRKICRVAIPSLAPISYLRLSQLYYDQSRFDEAVKAVDSLVSLFPASYFLPYGLKLKADTYLLSAQTREEGLELYRDLLENYATYPFAAEIRDIIRRETPTGQI